MFYVNSFPLLKKLSLLKLRNNLVLLIIFFVTFLSFVIANYLYLQRVIKADAQSAVQSIQAVRGYQGLILDAGGIASITISLLEKSLSTSMYVSELELHRGNQLKFKQSFIANSSDFSDSFLSRSKINASLDEYTIHAKLLVSNSTLINILLKALLSSTVFTFAFAIFKKYQKQKKEILAAELKQEIALQLAHDIRSPIAAIKLVSNSIPTLPENSTPSASEEFISDFGPILKLAYQRISGIAESLLNENKEKSTSFELKTLMNNIVTEKQFILSKEIVPIDIQIQIDSSLEKIFIKGNEAEIKRVISNLINNSAEAFTIQKLRKIFIHCRELNGHSIQIEIIDNGNGIPLEILKKLSHKGSTFGKSNGNGLGLYHARKTIESFGGKFSISSRESIGTTIQIILPKN